jgi:hypothetical protein
MQHYMLLLINGARSITPMLVLRTTDCDDSRGVFFGAARQQASLPSPRQHDMLMVNAARGTNDSALEVTLRTSATIATSFSGEA